MSCARAICFSTVNGLISSLQYYRSDPRYPEKSLIAAQTYFFDHSIVYATLNSELGLQPLRLARSGCRKNIIRAQSSLSEFPDT